MNIRSIKRETLINNDATPDITGSLDFVISSPKKLSKSFSPPKLVCASLIKALSFLASSSNPCSFISLESKLDLLFSFALLISNELLISSFCKNSNYPYYNLDYYSKYLQLILMIFISY